MRKALMIVVLFLAPVATGAETYVDDRGEVFSSICDSRRVSQLNGKGIESNERQVQRYKQELREAIREKRTPATIEFNEKRLALWQKALKESRQDYAALESELRRDGCLSASPPIE